MRSRPYVSCWRRPLGSGSGFVERVIIDQHFAQRHRMNRLLSVLLEHPDLLGSGIDEDTALVVHQAGAIKVIGEGNVSVLDCRHAQSNIGDLGAGERPQIIGALLHLLPSGSAFALGDDAAAGTLFPAAVRTAPATLADFIASLLTSGPSKCKVDSI